MLGLADPTPVFGVPLAEGDPSDYDLVIDYCQPPQPPLSKEEAGLREEGC